MADDLSEHQAEFAKLAPAARARVSAALKSNVAAELAGKTTPQGKASEFSKGAFFSRSRGNAMVDDHSILDKASSMDKATFEKFAQNLHTLKNLKGGTPG